MGVCREYQGNTRGIRVEPGGQAADTGANPTWDGPVLHPNREGAPDTVCV